MRRVVILAMVLAYVFIAGCKKDENPVPDVSFTAYIDILLPDYAGTVFTVNRDRYGNQIGISGIIVYRLSDVEFYAFERYCPHDKKISCRVTVAEDNTLAVCPCCKSEFLVLSSSGDVVSGPSNWGLKRYRAELQGNYLVVAN